jgi:hypothetical protein
LVKAIGFRVRAGKSNRRHRWPGCENHGKRGKHRTEVTEVTEGGLGLVRETFAGDTVGLPTKIRQKEKHRRFHASRSKAAVFTKTVFNGAMLSPLRVTPARKPRTGSRYCHRSGVLFRPEVAAFTKTVFNAPPNFPSVTSVRCFPLFAHLRVKAPHWESVLRPFRRSFPPGSRRVHPNSFQRTAQFPLCDLSGLCAMLSLLRVAPAWKPRCPPNSFPQELSF